MCDWPKSDCDVSVTDRQTNTLRFWPITFESPSHQGARLCPRAPWWEGNKKTAASASCRRNFTKQRSSIEKDYAQVSFSRDGCRKLPFFLLTFPFSSSPFFFSQPHRACSDSSGSSCRSETRTGITGTSIVIGSFPDDCDFFFF